MVCCRALDSFLTLSLDPNLQQHRLALSPFSFKNLNELTAKGRKAISGDDNSREVIDAGYLTGSLSITSGPRKLGFHGGIFFYYIF